MARPAIAARLLGLGSDSSLDAIPGNTRTTQSRVRAHPRITLIEGDAVACFPQVAALLEPSDRVLVIEDSSHTYDNTLAVLRTYSGLTQVGDYFIVEDSICHHGLEVGPSPGPYEAIEAFVAENPAFEINRDCESFVISWNPTGFLQRILA